MPRVYTRQRPGVTIDLKPIGGDGLVLATDGRMLPPTAMRQARNIDATTEIYSSRKGDGKVWQFDDQAAAHGAKVFGADSKYAYFVPPLIPVGGFWFKFHITAVRPGAPGARYILSSWTAAAETHYVLKMTLNEAGLFTISVEWESGGTASLTTTLAANAATHGLFVYDNILGTIALYINGDLADGPDAVGTQLQPRQDASVTWYLGLSYKPTVGVDAGTSFAGALDAFTLGSFAGVDPDDEDATIEPPRESLLWQLRRRSWQDWPAPQIESILVHYAMDEVASSGGAMYDFSMGEFHGTYVGAVTDANRIALRAQVGNFIAATRRATVGQLRDGRVNIAVVAGQHYYEIISPGA